MAVGYGVETESWLQLAFQREVEDLSYLLKNGFSSGHLSMVEDERKRILICGDSYGNGIYPLTITDKEVVMSRKRGAHFEDIAKKFAEDEGLEFKKASGFVPYGSSKRVWFVKWKSSKPDYTPILNKTTLRKVEEETPEDPMERLQAYTTFDGFGTSEMIFSSTSPF